MFLGEGLVSRSGFSLSVVWRLNQINEMLARSSRFQ
jgi:hypothetical protein